MNESLRFGGERINGDSVEVFIASPHWRRCIHVLKLVWLCIGEEERFIGTDAQIFFNPRRGAVRHANERLLSLDRSQIHQPRPRDERIRHVVHTFVGLWDICWDICTMSSPLSLIAEPEHPGKCARADVAQGFRTETCGWDEEGAVEEISECDRIFEGDTLVVKAAVGHVGEVGGHGVGTESIETCFRLVEGVEGDIRLM